MSKIISYKGETYGDFNAIVCKDEGGVCVGEFYRCLYENLAS